MFPFIYISNLYLSILSVGFRQVSISIWMFYTWIIYLYEYEKWVHHSAILMQKRSSLPNELFRNLKNFWVIASLDIMIFSFVSNLLMSICRYQELMFRNNCNLMDTGQIFLVIFLPAYFTLCVPGACIVVIVAQWAVVVVHMVQGASIMSMTR